MVQVLGAFGETSCNFDRENDFGIKNERMRDGVSAAETLAGYLPH
jgi:hypothetical protein